MKTKSNIIIATTKLAHFAGNRMNMKGNNCFDTAIVKDKKGNVYECSWGLNLKEDFVKAHPKRLFVQIVPKGFYELIFKRSLCKTIKYKY